MSTSEIISSLCDDKDLTEGLTKILDENGVKQLRLLESLSPESELFKKVMSSLEADDALKLKAPLASVVLSSAAKEASAQLNFAVSNAIASAPKPSNIKERL
ncbi:hypothetical protein FOL47_000223 [Perkinsus chesapeaki]|uniref:Uncharacterized protein n=1 Tax=Perkinsus chesapeaki TaxID=330153 RepID=A0A7J6KZ56_PERCH|nr:hypothetical protein FOL47_000223 [Perkinsus chesapeaki]